MFQFEIEMGEEEIIIVPKKEEPKEIKQNISIVTPKMTPLPKDHKSEEIEDNGELIEGDLVFFE